MIEKLKAELAEIKQRIAEAIIGEEKVEFAATKTDKAVLIHDAEELKVGVPVYVEDEEGNRIPAEDGIYVLEDGTRLSVAEGRIAEIIDKGEETENEAEDSEDAPEVLLEAEEAPEANDADYVTREEYEGVIKEINELYKLVDGLMAKVGTDRDALDARLRKVEEMPMGNTPAEEFENINNAPKTGDATIDKKMAYVSAWGAK